LSERCGPQATLQFKFLQLKNQSNWRWSCKTVKGRSISLKALAYPWT
jgi:hypothetical protein